MAPSPEHDKEPKAPDKTDNKTTETADIRSSAELINEQLNPAENLGCDPQESSVSTLDDVQLKSLLDEAINYKTPKDREGKSQIFKDLLQEAEEDERNARAASASGPQLARYYNTAARRHKNRKETASSTLTHGGSLQDLAQSDLYADSHNVSGGCHPGSSRRSGGRRHRQTGQKTVSVSARQREGGSLPSNVNAGARNLLFDDYIKKEEISTTTDKNEIVCETKPEYTIIELGGVGASSPDKIDDIPGNCNNIDLSESADETRNLLMKETRSYSSLEITNNSSDVNVPKYWYPHGECSSDRDEPPPPSNNKHPVPRHQYFNPLEECNKLPRIKYTSMAKVEIDSPLNTNVDKTISFSQFSSEREASVDVDAENTTVVSTVSGRAHALTKLTSDYRLLALPTNTKTLERFKGLDENGNSLQPATASSTSSGFDAKKKSKKSKVDRNVSVLDAKDIAGHQADIIQDIDQLVKYIEENDDKTTPKGGKHPHHVKPPNNAPLEAKKLKRLKTKSETTGSPKSALKKSNSLEEISKTKFTDYLINADGGKRPRVKKQSTSEDGDSKKEELRDRRSWGSEDSQQYMLSKHQRDFETSNVMVVAQETAEFHVVTKKKKSKKRTTSSSASRFDDKTAHHYHYHKIENTGAHAQQYPRGDKDKTPGNRKSACSVPPSDKSGESSDGDSVHSLPAATTRRKPNPTKPENEETATNEFNDTLAALAAVGSNSTSYADIARNNYIINQKSIALKSSEHFPELSCTLDDEAPSKNDEFPALLEPQSPQTPQTPQTEPIMKSSRPPTININNNHKQCSEVRAKPTILTNNGARRPPAHQLNNRVTRPAVIILNDLGPKDDLMFVQQSPSEPIQVSGLTFGFELNEQLLNDENHYEQAPQPQTEPQPQQSQQHFCARFLAPPGDVRDNYNHDKIVQFIGMAWEELIHDNKGKIQYYDGQ